MGTERTRWCLPTRVHDHPATVALLDVGQRERGDLGPTQATTEQDSQHGAVAHTLARAGIWPVEQALGIDLAQPVAGAHAGRGHALDSRHAGGELRVEQAVVRCFASEGANGRELLVDGRGRQAGLEQQGAVALDGGAVECGGSHLSVPLEKIEQGAAVHGLASGGVQPIQHQPYERVRICEVGACQGKCHCTVIGGWKLTGYCSSNNTRGSRDCRMIESSVPRRSSR